MFLLAMFENGDTYAMSGDDVCWCVVYMCNDVCGMYMLETVMILCLFVWILTI